MTELENRVADVVAGIPRGRVATYGAIGRAAGTSARTVGRILNGVGHELPWWRVVSADGRPFAGALERARRRLAEEKTPLRDGGPDLRVDLAQAEWDPTRRRRS